MVSRIERYGVYWVNLDPTVGSEISKTGPAVVVSDDLMNRHLQTVVVCPITLRIHEAWPSRITTTVAGRRSEIAVDQIRTISTSRIGEKIASLDATSAEEIRHLITVMFGVLSVPSPD